ncbi:hypothetical protein RB195_003295 [Necator americanus]|uniref:Uncharacterized protein n=1 Tax=Necator americanus TaxID=51031 RepID=A0ABR1DMY6_NECAM
MVSRERLPSRISSRETSVGSSMITTRGSAETTAETKSLPSKGSEIREECCGGNCSPPTRRSMSRTAFCAVSWPPQAEKCNRDVQLLLGTNLSLGLIL